MGYLVPDTKKQMDDAFKYDLQDVFAQYNIKSETMEELIDAYHASPDAFNRNKDRSYQSLYETFQALGIGDGKTQEELFPSADRSLEHFKNTFQKLWRAVSVYAELTPFESMAKILKETEDVTLPNTSSVAEIYEHYDDRYDRILMEQDMMDEVNRQIGSDMYPNPMADSLKKLNTYLIFHATDDPFSANEKEKISTQISRLNKPFYSKTQTEDMAPGIFSGELIKTPADLKQYLDCYETMLCEFMKKSRSGFRKFAQSYKEPKEAGRIKKLAEADIYAARRKNADADLDAEFEVLMPKLDQFKNNRLKESVTSVCEQYQMEFQIVCESTTDTILNDSKVKNAEETLKESYKEAIAEQQIYESEYNASFINAKGNKKQQNLIDAERRQLGELLRNQKKALDDAKNISYDTGEYETIVKNAIARFKKAVREYRKETTDKQFKQELSDSRRQFYETFKEIKAERKRLQAHPDEEKQRLLDEKATQFTKLLNEKLEAFDLHQSAAEKKLQTEYEDCINQITQVYRDEREHRLGCVNQAIDTIKNRQKKFSQEDYPNNSYVTRMNNEKERRRQEAEQLPGEKEQLPGEKEQLPSEKEQLPDEKERGICDELRDICDALGSMKKTNLFRKEKANSDQYNGMMAAIDAYLNKQMDADVAYQYCEAYLALSLDGRGGVKNMGSKLGQLRKQACVRMMELLKPNPALAADGQEGNEQRQRINYETLKVSLARKSESIHTDQNDLNAKAYSNLKAKINEVKARNRKL